MIEVEVSSLAKIDFAEARDWYENKKPGLGIRFMDYVELCIESIRRFPEMNEAVGGGYRRAMVSVFPYVIYYKIGAAKVQIIGMFHTARDSRQWQRRLREFGDQE
jgi:toxin ParE1/3/4